MLGADRYMRTQHARGGAISCRQTTSLAFAFIATLAPTSLNLALAEPSAKLKHADRYGPRRPRVERTKDAVQRAKNRRVDVRIVDRTTYGGSQ